MTVHPRVSTARLCARCGLRAAGTDALATHVARCDGPGAEWMTDGLCRGVDPDLFFPERGEDERPAKAVCIGCPVRSECLEYALTGGEKFGIWGGMSERERRRERAARRRGAA